MAKIVSILSAGHSGSTLCDILIGTIPGVFSTGECTYFPWQLHRNGEVCTLGQDFCSCGKKFSECETWVSIVRRLNEKVGYDIYNDPFRFEMALYRNQAYGKSSTISTRILRAVFIRLLQYCSPLASFFFATHVCKQLDNNWLFFDTIGHTMSASHIVDSSKDIIRMKLLHQKRPDDFYVVLLIRNIEGVAASAAKRGKNPLAAADKWIQLYQQYLRILQKTDNLKLKTIHYEELVDKPEQVRDSLACFLGTEHPQSPLAIDTREHHLVAGNPMRYKGRISIKYDESWKQVLSPEIKDKIFVMRNKYKPIVSKLNALSES